MQKLNLKPTHKPIQAYYQSLNQYSQLNIFHETAIKVAFQNLLESCAKQMSWTLILEWEIKRRQQRSVRVDGALVDSFRLPHGFWEAKDERDDLEKEVRKKFEVGYPKDNILFQAPERAILWQNGRQVLDENISKPENLVGTLQTFFEYQPPVYADWEESVVQFGERVPQLAKSLEELIDQQHKTSKRYRQAFDDFALLCRQSINPNLADAAVKEMLIQHLLTERIFRKFSTIPISPAATSSRRKSNG